MIEFPHRHGVQEAGHVQPGAAGPGGRVAEPVMAGNAPHSKYFKGSFLES